MLEILKIFVGLMVFPGFLFALTMGAITSWIDRKVTARLQYRQGPPWFQSFADIIKLMGKEMIMPSNVSKVLFFGAPLLSLAGATLVSAMLWYINAFPNTSFVGDLIVLLYLLIFPSLAIILAGFVSRNPLAIMGSSREMKLMLAYELPFILAIFTVVVKSSSILVGQIILYQAGQGMAVASLSGAIAFIVALLCIQAKLGFVPFDIAEAEQELAGGSLIEYSGAALAILKMGKLMLFYALPLFLITIFWGGISLVGFGNAISSVLKYVLIIVLIVVIKNTNPRLREDQALAFFWGPVTILAVLAMGLALAGL